MSSSFCLSEEPFSESLCFNRNQLLTNVRTNIIEDINDSNRCSPEEDKLPLEFKRYSDIVKVKENPAKKTQVTDDIVVAMRESSAKSTRSQPSFYSPNSSASSSKTTATVTATTSPAASTTASGPIRDHPDSATGIKEYCDIKRGSQTRQRSSDRASSLSSTSSSSAMKLKALKGNAEPGASIFSGNNSKCNSENEVLCRRLDECAHFHYEVVELKTIELSLVEDNFDEDYSDKWLIMEVFSKDRQWKVRRSYHSLHQMDKQLHDCIFKRKFSMLPELTENLVEDEGHIRARGKVCTYFDRLTTLPVSRINCGPVLCWMEMDNRGNRVILPDSDSAINIPAVAAAHSIKPYTAQSIDELSLKVGDILSIIDKPPSNESSWWRGKKEFEVGFFPSDCVELLDSDKLPHSIASRCAVNTHLKHTSSIGRKNKLKSVLMSFFSTRPNRTSLKRSGIVKERLFNCDLGEHLLNSHEEVPAILKCCAEVLEVHGIVDGIYRLSGAASTINKLRNEFDECRIPDLTSEMYIQDIHSVSSLLKMYFRELPNPLLTYELYDKFIEAITDRDEGVRLSKICDVIRQLPPPHYRTAEYLFRHLNKMASHDNVTSMHCKNLAIVWAPNLLRSKELEQMNCGTAALRGVGIQAIVTEYLIKNVGVIFNEENQIICEDGISTADSTKLKSFSPMPTTQKLLSLEEAQERKSQLVSTHLKQKNFIEVGAGTAGLPIKYHTVINPKGHQSKDKKKLREKLPSPSRFRTLFRRSQSTSFKENQATEVVAKPSSAREKKTSSVGSESTRGGASDETNSTNNKRNLSTSALLSNGTPAGDASFGILDDLKRLSTSCEIPADLKEQQSKSGGKKLKNKHRSTSVDVASSELDKLLSVHVVEYEMKTKSKTKIPPSKEKSSKKTTSASRQSPVPLCPASAIPEVSSSLPDSKGKKNRKSKAHKKPETVDMNAFDDRSKGVQNIPKGSTNSEGREIDSKDCPITAEEDQLLDKPVLASDESDFKSDSLEAFEVLYADGLRGSPLENDPIGKRSDSGKMSSKNQKLDDKGASKVATLIEITPRNETKEEVRSVEKVNQEGLTQLNSSSRNDLLDWSLSSDVTGKDLYKELSPTFNDIWMGGGCYGDQADKNPVLRREPKLTRESAVAEKEGPDDATTSPPSSVEVQHEDAILTLTSDTLTAGSLSTDSSDIPPGKLEYSTAEEISRVEPLNITQEDIEWKMNNLEMALNILEQTRGLQSQPKEVIKDNVSQIAANDEDEAVFLPSDVESSAADTKPILEERKSVCSSPENLPKSRPAIKSTSSVLPPSTESLSDAALDLFSFDRMYSSESLSHAKLQVSNEDGYVYASYRDLYSKHSNKISNPPSSSKDHKLTSAPVMAPQDESEILRKLASYGAGGAGERTVMMPVGKAAKKSDCTQQKVQARNTVPSSCLSARIDEAFLGQSKNVCTPSTSSYSFTTTSQSSTDPLKRKENILSSPASNSFKESVRDKTDFLLRPSSNSGFRNHHHRHSSRHFNTPSPEIFHSSITPPLPSQTSDPFGAHASSVRLTSREIKLWQDRAARQSTSIEFPKAEVEQKFSKTNDFRSFHQQPSVIIFNKPSSILRSEVTGGSQKSQGRQMIQFGKKSGHENVPCQPKSPSCTQTQFAWSQKLSSNARSIETSRKSLPTCSSQFRKSISLDENGEEEEMPIQSLVFDRGVGSCHSQTANSSRMSFSRSETHQAENSAKEERFSTAFHQRCSPNVTAKCLNLSGQKSSQTADQSSSATPPTPRANQTFVLAKKQLFENSGNC